MNQGCHLPASEHCSRQVVKRERFTMFLQKASLASVVLVTGKAGIIDCCKKCSFQNNKYNTVNLYCLQNSCLMRAALPAWPEHQLFSNSIKDTQSLPWPSWFLASLTSPERGREENGSQFRHSLLKVSACWWLLPRSERAAVMEQWGEKKHLCVERHSRSS